MGDLLSVFAVAPLVGARVEIKKEPDISLPRPEVRLLSVIL